MESRSEKRRRAPRYPIEARVTVRKENGDVIYATTMDICGSGMLPQVEQLFPLQLGGEMTVELELPHDPDKALPAWGPGRVIRLDGLQSAIQLSIGRFDSFPVSGAADR